MPHLLYTLCTPVQLQISLWIHNIIWLIHCLLINEPYFKGLQTAYVSDKTVQMCRIIWSYNVCKWHITQHAKGSEFLWNWHLFSWFAFKHRLKQLLLRSLKNKIVIHLQIWSAYSKENQQHNCISALLCIYRKVTIMTKGKETNRRNKSSKELPCHVTTGQGQITA